MTAFEDIPDAIRQTSRNEFEEKNNITTGTIFLLAGGKEDLWALWCGQKSDGTNTLYFTFCSKSNPDYWRWMCPTKEHITGFWEFVEKYWQNEKHNDEARADRRRMEAAKKSIMDTPLSELLF